MHIANKFSLFPLSVRMGDLPPLLLLNSIFKLLSLLFSATTVTQKEDDKEQMNKNRNSLMWKDTDHD